VGHVARMGEVRNAYKIENLKGRDYSEDLGVDCKIILEWILGYQLLIMYIKDVIFAIDMSKHHNACCILSDLFPYIKKCIQNFGRTT
jgi:hypothetical protein